MLLACTMAQLELLVRSQVLLLLLQLWLLELLLLLLLVMLLLLLKLSRRGLSVAPPYPST